VTLFYGFDGVLGRNCRFDLGVYHLKRSWSWSDDTRSLAKLKLADPSCYRYRANVDDGLGGGFCSVGLGGYKGAKGDEKNGVEDASVVQERTDDLLELGEASGVQRSRFVS
jgi:hypothetical protein